MLLLNTYPKPIQWRSQAEWGTLGHNISNISIPFIGHNMPTFIHNTSYDQHVFAVCRHDYTTCQHGWKLPNLCAFHSELLTVQLLFEGDNYLLHADIGNVVHA